MLTKRAMLFIFVTFLFINIISAQQSTPQQIICQYASSASATSEQVNFPASAATGAPDANNECSIATFEKSWAPSAFTDPAELTLGFDLAVYPINVTVYGDQGMSWESISVFPEGFSVWVPIFSGLSNACVHEEVLSSIPAFTTKTVKLKKTILDWSATDAVQLCGILPVCGDSIKDLNEQCDDGNLINGDGCSSTCEIEESVCGNNIIEDDESCDASQLNGESCLTLGFDAGVLLCSNSCNFDVFLCSKFECGNNIIETGEQCDDGNNINDDGCSSQCIIERTDDCKDLDNDGVCMKFDHCPNSKANEPVDNNGCDIFQFCGSLSCGFSCFEADWKNNEDVRFPHDCTVVIPLNNGVEQQPICVPTEFTNTCAG